MNASAPPKLPAGGTVNNEEVEVYASHSATSSRIGTISISTPVTVTEVKRIDGNVDQLWYKVSYSGTSGWIRGGHVRFSSYSGCDLAYVDEQLFGSNLLEWNKSGGVMLPGLVYRRLGEAKIFCYGNYTDAHSGSANYRVNVGFDLPF